MRWEELTGDEFPRAVEQCQGVCLIPLSVIERHGHHLPLGTDMYIGRELCRRASALEPAIVFPDYIFTQILEARHLAGTIAIDGELIIRLLDNVCREVARNGLRKVVFVNAHGGNNALLPLFGQLQLNSPRDYVVYLVQPRLETAEETEMRGLWAPSADGHAGAGETSMIMAIRPELVDMQQVPADGEGVAQGRLKALREVGAQPAIWWYADHPSHYQGDAAPATSEKGERIFTLRARAFARAIRAIKEDTETSRLQNEFYNASEALSS